MKTFFKRFAIVLVIVIGVLALAWIIIASLFQEQVGRQLVTAINSQLKTELTVEEFELSAIRSFPSVAANLQGIVLEDSYGGALLEAEELSFRFGLLSLFSSSLDVKSVVVSRGAMNVLIDERGQDNYDIFKTEEEAASDSGTASGTSIALERAQLRDVELIYQDESTAQTVWVNVQDATFAGQFSSTEFALQSRADIKSNFVEMGGIRYLVGQDIAYDAEILVDLEEGLYDFQQVSVELHDNIFETDGTIEMWEKGPYFDLFFTCTEGNVSSLIALLPEQYLAYLSDFTSRGDFEFKAEIKGQLRDDLNPEVRAEISLDNGRIESPRMQAPLKDVSFTASFTNGRFRTDDSSIFEITNLKGYFSRELFEMRLRVENLEDPKIDFLADGVVPMESLYGLFNNPKITDGDGEIEVKNLMLVGQYSDMIDPSRMSRVRAGGELEFDDAELTINEEDMIIDRGSLQLRGDTLAVPVFELNGAGSDITFSGLAVDVIPVLFADSMNSKQAELKFQANLNSRNLDIDRLMSLSDLTDEEKKQPDTLVVDSLKTERIQQRQQITQFLKGTFDARIENFNYNKIEGSDFVGKLAFNNNELLIQGDTKAMSGTFDLDGTLFFEDEPRLEAKLICNNLDATEFFRQSENFGQEILTDDNVSGTMNAKVAIFAYWNAAGEFLYDKLRVLAGLNIRDGRLRDFEMLREFSTYVNVRDLMDIRFATLENYLEISNQTMYLPVMFIQSNAMNLTISGEHTFENKMNYNMKVNAGQVIANRFTGSSSRPQPARRNGWFNLYFNIDGTVDDYEVETAKREVQRAFLFSERRKDAVRQRLAREFGSIEFIEEPEEWQDEEYLDMRIEGSN